MAMSQHVFLYDMPAKPRSDLCKLLDQNSTWITLAEQMHYSPEDIEVSNGDRKSMTNHNYLLNV